MSNFSIKNILLRLLILILLIIGFAIIYFMGGNKQNYNSNYTENDIKETIQTIQESSVSEAYKKYQITTIQENFQIANDINVKEREVWTEDYKNIELIWINIKQWENIKEQYILLSDSFKKNSKEYLISTYWNENNFPTGPYSHLEYIWKQLKIHEEILILADLYINFYNYLLTIQNYISIENWEVYINKKEALWNYDKMIETIGNHNEYISSLEEDFSQYEEIYKEKNSEYLF